MINNRYNFNNRIYTVVGTDTESSGLILYKLQSDNHITYKYFKELEKMSKETEFFHNDLVYVAKENSWAQILYRKENGNFILKLVDPIKKVEVRRSEFKRDYEVCKAIPKGSLYDTLEMEEVMSQMDREGDLLLDLAGKHSKIQRGALDNLVKNDQEGVPSETTNRDNKGKPRPTLVEADFLSGLIDVLEMGAIKYSKDGWKKGLDPMEIMDSLERHALKWRKGERDDEESGLHHALHIAANCMFLYYFDGGE